MQRSHSHHYENGFDSTLTRKFLPFRFASDPDRLGYHNLLNIRGVVSLPAEW